MNYDLILKIASQYDAPSNVLDAQRRGAQVSGGAFSYDGPGSTSPWTQLAATVNMGGNAHNNQYRTQRVLSAGRTQMPQYLQQPPPQPQKQEEDDGGGFNAGGWLMGGLLGAGLAAGGKYLWDRYGTGIQQGKEAMGIWNELSGTEKWVIGKLYGGEAPGGNGKSQMEMAKDWLSKTPEERQAILSKLKKYKGWRDRFGKEWDEASWWETPWVAGVNSARFLKKFVL